MDILEPQYETIQASLSDIIFVCVGFVVGCVFGTVGAKIRDFGRSNLYCLALGWAIGGMAAALGLAARLLFPGSDVACIMFALVVSLSGETWLASLAAINSTVLTVFVRRKVAAFLGVRDDDRRPNGEGDDPGADD